MVTVVHKKVVALVLLNRPVRAPEVERLLGVLGVLGDIMCSKVVPDDGFVVVGAGKTLRRAPDAPGEINRRLVCDCGIPFLTRVATVQRVRATVPLDVSHVSGTDSPGEA